LIIIRILYCLQVLHGHWQVIEEADVVLDSFSDQVISSVDYQSYIVEQSVS